MKKSILSLGIIVLFSSFGLINNKSNTLKLEQNFVKISSHLLLHKYEVSNKEYQQFLNSLKEKNYTSASPMIGFRVLMEIINP